MISKQTEYLRQYHEKKKNDPEYVERRRANSKRYYEKTKANKLKWEELKERKRNEHLLRKKALRLAEKALDLLTDEQLEKLSTEDDSTISPV